MIVALEDISNSIELFTDTERPYKGKFPDGGKIWFFKTCQIDGVIYHSGRYKRVPARTNSTIYFSRKKESRNGSILDNYVKVQDQC